MSEVLNRLRQSTDPFENDLAKVYEHWQEKRRGQGLAANLGYEPRDINKYGIETVIASRVLKAASGFEEVDPELSYEALVLKYKDRFSNDVVKAATNRFANGDSKLVEFRKQDIQFLIKCYPSELFISASALDGTDDWIGRSANIPSTIKNDEYSKSALLNGFKSFVWFHENKNTGEKGRGLTALVEFGPMSNERRANVIDAIIFDRPIGKELLDNYKEESAFIKDLDQYRHTRTWPIKDLDVSLLLSSLREKIHTIQTYENLTPDPTNDLNLERIEDVTSLRKVVMRRNQQSFRKKLLAERPVRCAISGTSEISVLEAAHIIPFAERFADRDKIENGLLLRSDIHKLFDAHLIAIDPDTRSVVVSGKLTSPDYKNLQDQRITDSVSSKSLEFHFKKFEN